MAAIIAPWMADLEQQKVVRMRQNEEKMMALGIRSDIAQLMQHKRQQEEQQEEKRRQQREAMAKRKEEQRAAAAALREERAHRLEGRPRPNYKEALPKLYQPVIRKPKPRKQGAAAKQARTGGGSKGPVTSTKFVTWSPLIPRPPIMAQYAAKQAAKDFASTLKRPAVVRRFTKSHVCGGFWLAAGRLRRLLQHGGEEGIIFTCTDKTRPAESFRSKAYRGANTWEVKLILSKKGGFGFSGGWRGFAVDQFLHPGDVAVFEVTSRTTLRAHIYRAWDYATAEDKPAELEQLRFNKVTGKEMVEAAEAAWVDYEDDVLSGDKDDEEEEQQQQKKQKAKPHQSASSAKGRGRGGKQAKQQQVAKSAAGARAPKAAKG